MPNGFVILGDGVLCGYKGEFDPAALIPDGVKTIGGEAFANSSIESVVIPSSVSSIGWHAFENCRKMKSVTIPSGVTSIGGWAFCGCRGLTSVTIPPSVTDIGDQSFSGCSGLTSITMSSSVTNIGNRAFYECGKLKTVYVDGDVATMKRKFRECGFDEDGVTFEHVKSWKTVVLIIIVALTSLLVIGIGKALLYCGVHGFKEDSVAHSFKHKGDYRYRKLAKQRAGRKL